jgi:acetylornithine deacetylase/succinyl-diaminopimelate desuccinylase-like protein
VPGETIEQLFMEIEDLLARVRAASPELSTSVRRLPGSMATLVHGPLETPPEHPLVVCALACRRQVTGAKEAPAALPAWTDAALLSREAGIPCVVMGPGHLPQAHSADEWVAVEQLEEAALQYAAVALDFCGQS